jgi:hypothetical protein
MNDSAIYEIGISWKNRNIGSATLTVAIVGSPDAEWKAAFKNLVASGVGQARWGAIELTEAGSIVVKDVQQGSVEALKERLEFLVSAANRVAQQEVERKRAFAERIAARRQELEREEQELDAQLEAEAAKLDVE